MKHTRQISLHDRLSAMFRVLTCVAVAAMVFSLVFFSPLIDMKDTIAAAAQSSADRDERRSERAERRSERAERNSERQSERAERRSERQSERAERRSERAERQSERRSEQAERRSERNERSEKTASRSATSQPGAGTDISKNDSPAKDVNSNPAPKNNSGTAAPEKPASESFINRIFGEPKFSGDSEPSGDALSEREEREAIQNGWQ